MSTRALFIDPREIDDLKEEVKKLRRIKTRLEETLAMERIARAAEIQREAQRRQ